MFFPNLCSNRDEAATYRSDYGSPIPLPHLVQRVSAYMHAYTLYSSIRFDIKFLQPCIQTSLAQTIWSNLNAGELVKGGRSSALLH